MRESYYWFSLSFLMVIATLITIIVRIFIPIDPMWTDFTATFFGVLIAISLSEGIRTKRQEDKDKQVLNYLIEELRDILVISKRPIIREIFSATWTSIKTKGIPDRIDLELRKALTIAFELFDVYNESIRQREAYSYTPNPDERNVAKLDYIIEDSKRRLITAAEKALE